jgi:hypothetical protein
MGLDSPLPSYSINSTKTFYIDSKSKLSGVKTTALDLVEKPVINSSAVVKCIVMGNTIAPGCMELASKSPVVFTNFSKVAPAYRVSFDC